MSKAEQHFRQTDHDYFSLHSAFRLTIIWVGFLGILFVVTVVVEVKLPLPLSKTRYDYA